MAWIQLSLEAGDVDPERLSAFFEQQGALSVTFEDCADQPIFEPEIGTTPLWSATRLTALYEDNTDLTGLRKQMSDVFGQTVTDRMMVQTLEDRDWEREWLDQFKPMPFGKHLWVCPAGQLPEHADHPVIIDLDPGLAFGTGTHPTTALCLQWLDQQPPQNLSVLDYGCGSGILGIAALKLGAESVESVDIDRQALWASEQNARRNRVDGSFHTCLPEELPTQQFDLLLANILANPLIELAPTLAGYVREDGVVVLSGILSAQAQAVRAAYAPWFEMDEPVQLDDWIRLVGTRLQEYGSSPDRVGRIPS